MKTIDSKGHLWLFDCFTDGKLSNDENTRHKKLSLLNERKKSLFIPWTLCRLLIWVFEYQPIATLNPDSCLGYTSILL